MEFIISETFVRLIFEDVAVYLDIPLVFNEAWTDFSRPENVQKHYSLILDEMLYDPLFPIPSLFITPKERLSTSEIGSSICLNNDISPINRT